MKALTFNGKEPTVIPAQDVSRILDIIERQLRLLEQMTQSHVLIPEGTRVRVTDLPETQ